MTCIIKTLTEQAEQNDFDDFEILRSKKGQRQKNNSGWAEAVEVVLRVRITTVSWTSRRKKRKMSVDITVTKAGTNAARLNLLKTQFCAEIIGFTAKIVA